MRWIGLNQDQDKDAVYVVKRDIIVVVVHLVDQELLEKALLVDLSFSLLYVPNSYRYM